MEFISRPGELVVLSNGETYQVYEQIEYGDEAYIALRQVPNTESDNFDFQKYPIEFAKEIVSEGSYLLKAIKDKTIIKELSSLFSK